MNNFLSTRDLWNDWFDFNAGDKVYSLRADVIEGEKDYEILVNMPGFKKENISISLENGYLTIKGEQKSETNSNENDSKESDGKRYIRRERFYGQTSRSFYLGEGYTEEDVNASFEDGVLKVSVPKEVKKIENKKFIQIQ